MSYPIFVAASSTTNYIDVAVSPPSGIQRGDLLMLFVESANEAITTPSGWTIAPSSPQGTGTAGASGAVRLSVFYKFSEATEGNVTPAGAPDHYVANMLAFRNVNRSDPFDATAGSTATSSIITIHTLSAVTTTRSQCMIVNAVATDLDGSTGAVFSSWTNATTGNPTEQCDGVTSNGRGGGLAVATALKGTAGSTGSTTVTGPSATLYAEITYALNPEVKAMFIC